MAIEKKPAAYIWEAISGGNTKEVERLFHQNPDQINAYIPFGGGTFLHLAASKSSLEVVKCLIKSGFELNKTGNTEGETAIVAACTKGNYDIVEYLLDLGAVLDVSTTSRNPLFGAIVGRSIEIVRLLLERGIDSSIQYTGGTMTEMDAIAFAFERGESEIATIIAKWNANGNMVKAEALLAKSMEVALLNNQRSSHS